MSAPNPYHEANRLSWNAATRAHNSHKRDQAAFLRSGGSTLFPEETDLLGDIAGCSLLHLQCNSGQDTLSLARLGAKVTGVDISEEAIGFAQRLSAESGIPADFERADVYDWLDRAPRSAFDIAFASYGALNWLSDLDRWAAGIGAVLRSGGRLVVMEFHPVSAMFDVGLRLRHDYFGALRPQPSEGVQDYVAASGDALSPSGFEPGIRDFQNPSTCYEFQWSVADVLGSILAAGLEIRAFREYPYANGCPFFEGMRREGNRWYPPTGVPSMPLMYGLRAERC